MTHASSLPIAYVETNWVVACVVTHDKEHERARQLLENARSGLCEIRIPLAAVLESKHSVGSVSVRPSKQIAELRNTITKDYRKGEEALRKIDQAIQQALEDPTVRAYFARDFEAERLALLQEPNVVTVSDPAAEAAMLERLHPSVRLRGIDLIDYYVIASILVDRAKAAGREAMFFSTNGGDLRPGSKLDADFYEQRRMVYRPDFQLRAALNDWTSAFAGSAL